LASLGFAQRAASTYTTLNPDILGWASSMVLLATLLRQVYRQYRERSTSGVSSWLFIGQLTASTGFLIYSFMLKNWVFVFTNAALLLTAIAGQMIYQRNVREQN
jgi:MtN3 and saliva related transmembrane protein